MKKITIIGAGLAGSEAAWQIAKRAIPVRLFEMRPSKMTPAHHTPFFAELVCSNSLRAQSLENAVGLLKEEMRVLGSLVMAAADRHAVPAGGALAVDREAFAREITERLASHPQIEIVREEVKDLSQSELTIVATGPLTSEAMAGALQELTQEDYLYFYDAAAPLVEADSIDYEKVFWASRYDKGEDDYLNCPLNEKEYRDFYDALVAAEVHERHSFEKNIYFEGCMPVEVLAKRGRETLLYGPLKPVGLYCPGTKKRPHAVVQLRKDNAAGTLFNMVGFQTNLKWNEQKRVFRMIPGLENAEFARYGVMHRNTFINAPRLLLATTQLKRHPHILIAGQLSGVEGYVESAASGLIAGINASLICRGKSPQAPPRHTAVGSLLHYLATADEMHFQPMNITFGLLPHSATGGRDRKAKRADIARDALAAIKAWQQNPDIKV